MLVIAISGGLGNQMFQYAFYKSVKSINRDVKVDMISSWNKGASLHNGYELNSIFKLNIDFINKIERNKFLGLCGENRVIFKFKEKMKLLKDVRFYRKRSEAITFYEELLKINKKYIFGYFQSEKYFQNISDEIKRDFNFPEIDFSDRKNFEAMNMINNTNSVSIHVRRGDFCKDKNFYGICDLNYYRRAINKIKNSISKPYYYIFSDDIGWCKKYLDMENVVFIDHNKGKHSYKDMQLMGMCKHNIIANSTFSWWGAYLNKNDNKIIISPSKWFNDIETTMDIIPSSWIKIN